MVFVVHAETQDHVDVCRPCSLQEAILMSMVHVSIEDVLVSMWMSLVIAAT